ncbi:hypothetical protein [Phormidium nigroviride]
MSVSPIIVELTSTRSLLSNPPTQSIKSDRDSLPSRSPSIGPEDKI